MDIRTYDRGEVIFRQGDPGDCMYDIQFGRVGIFNDYGGPNEKKLAELMSDQLFGEMSLLDGAPRSATAVSLDPQTVVAAITEKEFFEYFDEQPVKILLLMQQMCNRLRRTSKDYKNACRTVYETVESEKSGKPQSGFLAESIKKLAELYKDFNFYAHT